MRPQATPHPFAGNEYPPAALRALQRELKRRASGLIYTRAGVLDGTRRRARRQPQAEQIVLDTRDAVTDNQ